jgi:glycosyltransferase involved in cell wall biosynthesis
MKVLVVCSINSGYIPPFSEEQVDALNSQGIITDIFLIKQKGILGYLRERSGLLHKIKDFQPDIIHAHYGLTGLFANLQRNVPVITTYIGSDINEKTLRKFSIISILLSKFNIFVSSKQVSLVKRFINGFEVIPFGVDYSIFHTIPKNVARLKLGLSNDKKIILFSSKFDRPEKNALLAFEAMKLLPNVDLIELSGKNTREEVVLLFNACDVGLLTSIREGSPQFIKELLACNRPIVSTNVGDVEALIKGIDGCFIVPFEAKDVANAINLAFSYDSILVPVETLKKNDNKMIAEQLIKVYKSVLVANI